MTDNYFSTYEKLRKEKMRESNLVDLAKDLNSDNLMDILGKIGALSLMPENGSLISNEIAKRANIKRGLFPSTKTVDENIRVPKINLFKLLQESVVFSEDEIRHIFMNRNIPIKYIESYACTPGGEKLPDNDFDSSVIYTEPIVKIDNKYIVLIPELLISAAIHRIIRLAVEHGAKSELIDTFRAATWDNIQFSLKLLDIHPISQHVLFKNKQNNQWLECCYQIDTDKIINIQYFSDDLKDYDIDRVFFGWVDDEIPSNSIFLLNTVTPYLMTLME